VTNSRRKNFFIIIVAIPTQHTCQSQSQHRVPLHRFPILAIAALHIAAKVCNTLSPRIQDYAQVFAMPMDHERIVRMEIVVLDALAFELGLPTPNMFALSWVDHAGLSNHAPLVDMVDFLLQLCVADVSMLDYLPSATAVSVVLTAQAILNLQIPIDWHWDLTAQSPSVVNAQAQLRRVLVSHFTLGHGVHTSHRFIAASNLARAWVM